MLRYFGFSVGLTVAALVTAVWFGGAAALLAVAVLGVLEVCLSFDNPVVNAQVLRRLSPPRSARSSPPLGPGGRRPCSPSPSSASSRSACPSTTRWSTPRSSAG